MAITPVRAGQAAARQAFVGRSEELAALLDQLQPGGSPVSFVHGVAGIGKSALLSTFAAAAEADDALVVMLDCRTIEPTQRGFLTHLGEALGTRREPTLEQVTASLASRRATVVILDNYEVFRLLDAWLRLSFAPALPPSARVVVSGREAPVSGWLAAGRPHTIALGPLPSRDAVELLRELDVAGELATRIARLVRGHPLALTLAASTAHNRPDIGIEDIASHGALAELASLYLEGIDDPETREALEAASVLRRVNVGLLAAMLPDASARACIDRLRALPFVETRHDGLVVHDAVREPIAASLKAADPARYKDYRRRAWRQMRTELQDATSAEFWRYSADLLYIFENPAVREAYFPSDAQSLAIEPARSDDWSAIARITKRHSDADEAHIVERWWRQAPHTFMVARNRDALVVAFLIFVDGKSILPLAVPEDPVVAQWAADLRADPLGRGQLAQGLRLWLDIDHADAPCGAQAAGFLDCKRSYMALRPKLARMYLTMRDPATYWPILEQLEFKQLEPAVALGSSTYTTGRLDFGAGSVDGWIARIVATELGLAQEDPLDESSRQIAVDGRRVQLTRLEFGVMQSLDRRSGRAASRRQLIEEVWGYEFAGGSNIVDSVVRSLRRKLGPHGALVESVRGVGYRLPHGWDSQLR